MMNNGKLEEKVYKLAVGLRHTRMPFYILIKRVMIKKLTFTDFMILEFHVG